jgi:hypothetical protein
MLKGGVEVIFMRRWLYYDVDERHLFRPWNIDISRHRDYFGTQTYIHLKLEGQDFAVSVFEYIILPIIIEEFRMK